LEVEFPAQRILFPLCYSVSRICNSTCPSEAKTTPKNKATQTRLFGGFKRTQIFIDFLVFFFLQYKSSGPLSSDAPGKLDVLGHYSHPLCMDCTQIGILKKTHKVGLSCFLECKNSMALETKISLQTRNKWLRSSVFNTNALKEILKHSPIPFPQSGINSSCRDGIDFRHVRKGDEKEFKP
jgi:hypothetical protein